MRFLVAGSASTYHATTRIAEAVGSPAISAEENFAEDITAGE
jgi:hypothetical protein